MSLNFSQRLSLLLLLALAVPSLSAGDWQASGTFTEGNKTEIYGAINSNPVTSTTTDTQLDGVAQAISTRLNRLWDPAWNVIIVRQIPNHNAVLYGYAFRNHWFWMNGVAIPGDSSMFLAYIIWKDYNCQAWSTINDLIDTKRASFSREQYDAIDSYLIGQSLLTDVWKTAFEIVEFAQGSSIFSSGALSIVLSTNTDAVFQGYVCIFDYKFRINSFLYKPVGGDTYYGAYFLFQTR